MESVSARWPLPHRTTRLSLLLLRRVRPLVFIVALKHVHLDELRPRIVDKVLHRRGGDIERVYVGRGQMVKMWRRCVVAA